MNVGKQIKELRLAAGMSREQLAKDLQIGTSTLSGYEIGSRSPNLETLCRIADYFDVTIDYLLGREKKPWSFNTPRPYYYDNPSSLLQVFVPTIPSATSPFASW